MICAALWPDPADPLCPQAFRDKASTVITGFATKAATSKLMESCSTESVKRWTELSRREQGLNARDDHDLTTLRAALLDFIADFANWDNSTVQEYLETSRALTQSAHEALGGEPGTRPLVVDPFAGGGSIPLEALRVGADAFASDLNPVAVLLNKVVLEYIPKYGQQLADEVRKWGEWIRKEAEKELAEFYPKAKGNETPIAYLWARTIKCEGPGCGAEVPLMRSLWLSKKGTGSVALRIIGNSKTRLVKFEIITNAKTNSVSPGTIRRGAVTCPCCQFTTPVTSVRKQLSQIRGGADDARMIAVRFDDRKTGERSWRLPNSFDISAANSAIKKLDSNKRHHKSQISLVPDELLPPEGTLGFRVQKYGMRKWGDLFTSRQALALTTFGRLVREAKFDYDAKLSLAVRTCLALAVDRLADFNASLCILNSVGGRGVVHVFGRQALPMVWDFMETNPFNTEAANWQTCFEVVDEVVSFEKHHSHFGHVEMCDASSNPLPNDSAAAFITDPPYYDAVPYADLSDFFYVWLRRNLPNEYPGWLNSQITIKDEECIVDEVRGKDRKHFEQGMTRAMANGRRILRSDGIAIVVFAHKSTSGWEALLQAMIDAGWIVSGSWPIDTERPGRLRAQNSAALASSIHLVCRPRENPDGFIRTDEVGDWRELLAKLPKRIHEWMPRLAQEGVVGADAIFACLGPALEIFSRYSKVEKASGEQVMLKEYLEHVWAAVAKEALIVIFEGADATGFEEDARLTAMWLWTLTTDDRDDANDEDNDEDASDEEEGGNGKKKSLGGYVLEYDAARKIAQGLGARLERLVSLVEVVGETARLLPVEERARYLFGKDAIETQSKRKKKERQLTMFEIVEEIDNSSSRSSEKGGTSVNLAGTVLDRVHQSMLLFATGRSEALRRFLVEDGIGRDQRFWILAQHLTALYPKNSNERRWVEGVLARKKGLGF